MASEGLAGAQAKGPIFQEDVRVLNRSAESADTQQRETESFCGTGDRPHRRPWHGPGGMKAAGPGAAM